jgi:putative ABC transport system permease protein
MIGALGSLLLAFGTFSVVSAQGWNEMVFRFEPSAAGVFASLGLATSVGAVGGFLPALRAARMPLLGALRD